MSIRYSATETNLRRNATYPGRDGGSIEIYTGAPPAKVADAITSQILLLTYVLPNPVSSFNITGFFQANAIADAVAVATGIAQWYRQISSGSVTQRDGVIGLNSTDDMQISDVNITNGQVVTFVQWTEFENNLYNSNPLA